MACGRFVLSFGLRRQLGRRCRKTAAAFVLAVTLVAPAAAAPPGPEPLKTVLAASTVGGYARLVFAASEYLDASARVTPNVLIISFQRPIDVSLDRVVQQAAGFVAVARQDPDHMAVRMALQQSVTVHIMTAGEKLFVDLLPTGWTGLPPGLPQDVVDELAKRARAAEQLLQREREANAQRKQAPIQVHVATEPTFTRYVFDVPDKIAVLPERGKDRLVLQFNAPVTFDLANAQAALPVAVQEITSELDQDTALVRFMLAAKADVRSFRDEKGYVVDVVDPAGTPAAAKLEGAPADDDGKLAVAAAKISAAAAAAAATAAAPALPPAPSLPPPTENGSAAANPAPPPAPVEGHAPQAAAAADAAKPASPEPVKPAAASAPPQAAAAEPTKPPATADATKPPAAAEAAKPAAAPSSQPPQSTPPPPETPKPSAAAAPAPAPPAAAAQAPPAPPAPKRDAKAGGKVVAELAHQGATVKLSFAFDAPVAAAVFHRADTLWIVFDAKADIDLSGLDGEPSRTIRGYDFSHGDGADVVRLKLDRPHLASVVADGTVWTVDIGDAMLDPTRALDLTRNLIGPHRSSVTISLDQPQQLHRLADPEVGDTLFVVTALPPARGFIDERDFIEFRALASTQGVVIDPVADDVKVELAPDKVIVSRPSGLTLSTSLQTLLRGSGLRPVMFDSQLWGFDRQRSYFERQGHLIAAAAEMPDGKRLAPRLDLARFYIARGMYPEAKGVLDVALADEHSAAESVSALVLRAVAEVMMNRPEAALKDLADPSVGDQHDAPLWRALAYARQGRWTAAREQFKTIDAAVATLPVELQRVALKEEMRAAIEVGDFDGATTDLNDFETIGIPHDMEPVLAALMGRIAEGMGRTEDALAAYRTAADSWDRPAAAQGLLRETVLRYKLGDLKRDEVISQLESLTTIWRSDETEIEALKVLAHLYTEDGRYRDAFYVMRSAMAARPDSALTHQIQDEAAATFDSLFLAGKGDAMPAIDALALFYDFRELTPAGNRGDEMIRRLADRLVSVDLLDQAADLLQYQVDHRLQGAARAQVATRLAVIYLMNRKPDRALAVLRGTRTPDLAKELRDQRLLLEARALSDLGRHDLALEVAADIAGRAAMRLRSDILWASRRWRESAEQIELMYGDRYKDFQPLSDVERSDILRAEIAYALAEDALGLQRFREKYAAKMAGTPDARAFDTVSSPLGTSGDQFAAIAHSAASVDTLDGFLREMKARYPESSAISSGAEPPLPAAAPSPSSPSVSSSPPAPELQPGDSAPPVLPAVPPARATGRTAQQ